MDVTLLNRLNQADERAGRWWCEDSEKERGLHVMSNITVDNNDDR